MTMEKIWLRLGGCVTASKEEIWKIANGDKDALISAIKANGFEVSGESYIPESCVGNVTKIYEDVEFDIDGVVLR